MLNFKKNWLVGIVIGVCSVAIIVFSQPKKTAVVNLQQALAKPAEILSHSRLSKEKQARIMKAYARALTPTIASYGKSHGLTIINSSVLFDGNGQDITNTIVKLTLNKVSQHD